MLNRKVILTLCVIISIQISTVLSDQPLTALSISFVSQQQGLGRMHGKLG